MHAVPIIKTMDVLDRHDDKVGAVTEPRRPVSALHMPGSALAGLIFASFERDTRDCGLSHEERYSYFAATPLCGVTLMLEGEARILDWATGLSNPRSGRLAPQWSFAGPHDGPGAGWTPGGAHGVTIGFWPDAFAALTGIDMSAYRNRFVALEEVADEPLLEAFAHLAGSGAMAARLRRFEAALLPLWQTRRKKSLPAAAWLSDWVRGVSARAATANPGRSLRQAERRMKAWTGQSKRELLGYGRTEKLYASTLRRLEDGTLDWAALAAEAGYSDQSHMVRRVRRETGFTPENLLYLIANHEAFWAYRLFAQRF